MTERCLQWIAVDAAAVSSRSAGSHLPGSVLRNVERGLVRAEFVPVEEWIRSQAGFSAHRKPWAVISKSPRKCHDPASFSVYKGDLWETAGILSHGHNNYQMAVPFAFSPTISLTYSSHSCLKMCGKVDIIFLS